MFRAIELKSPVFSPKDFDFSIGCEKAFIEPDFSRVADKGAIRLSCVLEKAVFQDAEEKLGDAGEFFPLAGAASSGLFEKIKNFSFDNIFVTLEACGETVDIISFDARSGDIKILASGSVNEKGKLEFASRIFFSPAIASELSGDARGFLKEESSGWMSYSASFSGGENASSLKFDSDRIKIEFNEMVIE